MFGAAADFEFWRSAGMRSHGLKELLFGATLSLACMAHVASAQNASMWLTTADRTTALQRSEVPVATSGSEAANVITVDPKQTFQTMDGFGFALTGGSAQLLMKMDPARRAAILREVFSREGDGIGVSYLRLTIGASDMNDHVFSYDDLPVGETDQNMVHFSIDPDRADVIPVMKQILAINPGIKVLASPWSAPLWMKTTGRAQGGVLKPEDFASYALYLTKYIQAMQAEGIRIDTLTIQNEPLNEKNTPSMLMLGEEQDVFIKENLGPAFRKANIKTGIVLYDHNLDHPLYVLDILRDKAAAQYVDGSGWHLYGGRVEAMTQVHDAFPSKNIYFTEQSTTESPDKPVAVADPIAHVMIGVSRNWSKNVLLWNLAADPNNGPHTDNGGCSGCRGALTIDGNAVTRLLAFYTVAQVSKFVPPGSVRIGSSTSDTLPDVAFRTPDGHTVVVVSNVTQEAQNVSLREGARSWNSTLPAGAAATYVIN